MCFGSPSSPPYIYPVASTQIIFNIRTCNSKTKLHLFAGLAAPSTARTTAASRALRTASAVRPPGTAHPGPAAGAVLSAVLNRRPRRLPLRLPPSPILRAPVSVRSPPYRSHKRPATSFAASPRQAADSSVCFKHRNCLQYKGVWRSRITKSPPGPLPRL